MAYLAKDLSPEQRMAIESLLGRIISEGPVSLPAQRRAEIIAGLEDHLAAQDAACEPVPPQEADIVFEEAMRQTRPNYRTHR